MPQLATKSGMSAIFSSSHLAVSPKNIPSSEKGTLAPQEMTSQPASTRASAWALLTIFEAAPGTKYRKAGAKFFIYFFKWEDFTTQSILFLSKNRLSTVSADRPSGAMIPPALSMMPTIMAPALDKYRPAAEATLPQPWMITFCQQHRFV